MNIVAFLFNIFLFLVPLILFPFTSEVFEFNKIVLVYIFTVLIVGTWIANMVLKKKIIFRRTILDIPILLFLATQILSTIFSIDQRTSFFGYYSRFHGGLLSSFCYSLLYWSWASNMNKNKTLKAIKILLASALIVSIYGVLERLGIDKNVWVQDVQNRVFSTLGQPNWLAAWLVALSPLSLAFILNSKESQKKQWVVLFSLFFLVILFTKSRSGILGFSVSYLIFWVLVFQKNLKKFKIKEVLKNEKFKFFKTASIVILVLALFIGTPWTKGLTDIFNKKTSKDFSKQQVVTPLLEKGGTESGEIRKIVWKGAINIWADNLIFGSGVETFAFSYYKHRPQEHNLVSEWDFIYNKAHNEYLNILATTGTIGFLSYLALLVFISIQIKKEIQKDQGKNLLINYALISGFFSILITNFFGFSVVPITLLFFLFPAMSISLSTDKPTSFTFNTSRFKNLLVSQKLVLVAISIITFCLLFFVSKYWYQDVLFAKSSNYLSQNNPQKAREALLKTINLSQKEALYWNRLSNATTDYAISLIESNQENNLQKLQDLINEAIAESMKAENLSPANVNILRDQSIMYIKLSIFNPDYLLNAEDSIKKAIVLAPTDAKLYYNLGLTLVRMGRLEEAKEIFEKTIEMKANYVKARLALGIILPDLRERQRAIEELQYILDNLDPNNKLVKQQLEEIR